MQTFLPILQNVPVRKTDSRLVQPLAIPSLRRCRARLVVKWCRSGRLGARRNATKGVRSADPATAKTQFSPGNYYRYTVAQEVQSPVRLQVAQDWTL